jgi:septum formation topological specificity factor MinE
LIQGMLMTLDKGLFDQVQREALNVVGQYTAIGEKEVVLPVLMANGTVAIPELRNDIVSIVQLTSQSLYFNLSPFFLGDGLKDMFQPA